MFNRRIHKRGAQAAFPHDSDPPSRVVKGGLYLRVANQVSVELCLPEIGSRDRCAAPVASSMSVPEAAVNEDRDLPRWKNNIRFSRQPGRMQPEAQAGTVKPLAQHDFRFRVPATYARHHARARARIDYVAHVSESVIFSWT